MEPQFPKEYNLTFVRPGTFEYFCAFHSMMKGNVTVQPAGSPYPLTQLQIDLENARLLAKDIETALRAEPEALNTSSRPGQNNTTIHEVNLGHGDGLIAWMGFAPANLTIQAGDSVEWVQRDVEVPHTVSFIPEGEEPEVALVEPQPMGPPKLVLNPKVLMPAGGETYDKEGYFNSGFIWGTKVPLPGPRNYTLAFDVPGTYKYICILHDEMGMHGQIAVLAKNES